MNVVNPLMTPYTLVPFSQVTLAHMMPALEAVIKENKHEIERLVSLPSFTWENIVKPLEVLDDKLHRVWSPISHLNAVASTDVLREIYHSGLEKIIEYEVFLSQHEKLYEAFLSIKSQYYQHLDPVKQKVIDDALRDFRLSGVALSQDKRVLFQQIKKELLALESQFEDNVLDATDSWFMDIEDENLLSGISKSDKARFFENARKCDKKGYRLTLDFPSYHAVMTECANRSLRETLYRAHSTRASHGSHDNTLIMKDILKKRHELSTLLGFSNYADYALKKRMVSSSDAVMQFLEDLCNKSKSAAYEDKATLETFAKESEGVVGLKPWDVTYYTTQFRKERYLISEEKLREYFPLPHVIKGLFALSERLFGLSLTSVINPDVWHESVLLFEIKDAKGELRGKCYFDLFARPKKRPGAWMDEALGRYQRPDGTHQVPVAYVQGHGRAGVGGGPALLTHDDVLTLFHEYGHALHHILSTVDHLSVSGIRGVPWDAVECPSQLMEAWCWDKAVLRLLSSHVVTGASLGEEEIEALLASRNCLSGLAFVRQLEFALMDFRLHREYADGGESGDYIPITLQDARMGECRI